MSRVIISSHISSLEMRLIFVIYCTCHTVCKVVGYPFPRHCCFNPSQNGLLKINTPSQSFKQCCYLKLERRTMQWELTWNGGRFHIWLDCCCRVLLFSRPLKKRYYVVGGWSIISCDCVGEPTVNASMLLDMHDSSMFTCVLYWNILSVN